MASSSSLSREEKLERLSLIQEKKRRLRRTKAAYRPHPGQLRVHQDPHPIRLVAAANGYGKSACAVNEAIWAATGYNPITDKKTKVPAKVIVLLDSPAKIEDVWLAEMRKWYNIDDECKLAKHGKPYVSEIEFKNGSRIVFMTHLMEPLSFEGIELDYLLADEPFPRPIWIALTRGARTKGSRARFLIIGTPLAQAWMYEELYQAAAKGEREDIGIHRGSTEENKNNLADGFIEQFSRNLSDQEKRVRLHGVFAHLEGLALAHLFDQNKHVIDPFTWSKGKPVVIAIDPHFNKPTTAVMLGMTGDGRIYVLKEFIYKGAPTDIALKLKEWYRGHRVLEIIVDSLGSTPMSGGVGARSFIQVLNDNGVRCRATSYDDKSDEEWIARIQDVLEIPAEADTLGRQLPKLAIFRTCKGLINDIETVMWQKYRNLDEFKPRLDISNKDYLSCLKYGLTLNVDAIATNKYPKIKRSGRSPWSGTPL